MAHYEFFQNQDCEYFPCHADVQAECFNCLFCYCPLYALGDLCGGDFVYTPEGIKDCSNCVFPHEKENYPEICRRISDILELAKRNPANRENP